MTSKFFSLSCKFLICLIICLGGGWLTGMITQIGIKEWYPLLHKSALTPPNVVFPITWTVIYCLMAISLFLVWISPVQPKMKAFVIFGLQLILNFAWSWIFFYLQQPAWALGDIILLWLAIGTTIKVFYDYSPLASYLLVFYWLWVSFATYLNYFIWMNN